MLHWRTGNALKPAQLPGGEPWRSFNKYPSKTRQPGPDAGWRRDSVMRAMCRTSNSSGATGPSVNPGARGSPACAPN